MNNKSKKGRRSRKKGQEYQCEVSRQISPVYPKACSGSQYRGGRKDGADVELTPWYIECKNTQTISIPSWYKKLQEDRRDAKDMRPPAIIFKCPDGLDKRKVQTMVAIRIEDFVRLERDNHLMYRFGPDDDGHYLVVDDCDKIGRIFDAGDDKWDAYAYTPDKNLELVLNPRKNSGGLWSTLDDAEAAIRREFHD